MSVVDLQEYRLRDLGERQRVVYRIIMAGESECGLCGDLGAMIDPDCGGPRAGEPVPCMGCGRMDQHQRAR